MLFYTHSGVRYLVLLVGILALGYAVVGAVGRRPYDRTMLRLASAFAGLMHLQVLLGIAILFTRRFYPALTGHIVLMVFAAIVAQIVPSVMRRRQPDQRSFVPHAVGVLVTLALIVMGTLAIGRGPFESIGG
jgi:heme A synthase